MFYIDPPTATSDDKPLEDVTPIAAYRSTPKRLKVRLLEDYIKATTR